MEKEGRPPIMDTDEFRAKMDEHYKNEGHALTVKGVNETLTEKKRKSEGKWRVSDDGEPTGEEDRPELSPVVSPVGS